MSRLFISYAHADLDVARRLYHDLQAIGHQPWLDKIDLLPGDVWRHRISLEIRRCKFFLALLSGHSLSKRGFVQKELKLAIDMLDEIPIDERFLIPIRLDDCDPTHERLRDLQWIDLFASYDGALKTLRRALAVGEATSARLYCDAGIEVPHGIGRWDPNRLLRYIDEVLWPEVRVRAAREYEYIDLPDRERAIAETAAEKLTEVAERFGFLEASNQFLERRTSQAT